MLRRSRVLAWIYYRLKVFLLRPVDVILFLVRYRFKHDLKGSKVTRFQLAINNIITSSWFLVASLVSLSLVLALAYGLLSVGLPVWILWTIVMFFGWTAVVFTVLNSAKQRADNKPVPIPISRVDNKPVPIPISRVDNKPVPIPISRYDKPLSTVIGRIKIMPTPRNKRDDITAQESLDQVVAQFEKMGQELYDDGVWQCDVGAFMLACLCDQVGLKRSIRFGLYWHKDKKSYARATGEWHDGLDENAGKEEEYHYWLEVSDTRLNHPKLLDPNGEVRGEPRIQNLDSTDNYEAFALDNPDAIDPVEPDYDPMNDPEGRHLWGENFERGLALIRRDQLSPPD